MLLEIKVL